MNAAVILAGGRGERLGGVVKSGLSIGGVRLLDRVAAALAGCTPILLAHGRLEPELLGAPPAFELVPDLPGEYAGPLAGVAGAIERLCTLPRPPEVLVVAAVDTPFLPSDYVERLLLGLGTRMAALASYDGQSYPTSSAWRFEAVANLPDRVRAGEAPHSLKRLAAELGGVEVAWPLSDSGDPFANANTPDDLERLERRAATRR